MVATYNFGSVYLRDPSSNGYNSIGIMCISLGLVPV